MKESPYLDYTNTEYIENLRESYHRDSQSVDEHWQKFFEGLDFALKNYAEEVEASQVAPTGEATQNSADVQKLLKVLNLVNAYRSRGHLITENNPIRPRSDHRAQLELTDFGLTDADLKEEFDLGGELGFNKAKLSDIIDKLKRTYCATTGVEYMHMRAPDAMKWLQERVETNDNVPQFDIDKKKLILRKLNEAEVFEKFLQTKYIGQKRFSLEGAEVLIPALEFAIQKSARLGAKQAMLGMAHRGRLNVLANILGKTYEGIFSEFEDFPDDGEGAPLMGDVKYHKGFSTIREIDGHDFKVSLAFNPSHLEAVNTVISGMSRAKSEQWFDSDHSKMVPIIIHGDAAISGQGIVYEHLQMGALPGYTNGGTIHIVVNNQIGFTTNYGESRSTVYCTDIGKANFSPVFHVNGYDAEAVAQCMETAIEYRQKFGRDVFLDIICTRKYGHNEADEPRFTQPIMYKILSKLPNVRETYSKQLSEQGHIEAELSSKLEKEFKSGLQKRMDLAKEAKKAFVISSHQSKWSDYRFSVPSDWDESPETGVDSMNLGQIGEALTTVPEDFNLYSKNKRLLNDRKKMLDDGQIPWPLAELLSFGSLLIERYAIRLSGQDVQRGTFSSRHSLLKDELTEAPYINLNHINDNQSKFYPFNSLLSEYGVLGFEYGYSLATPKRLTIWEAQFGDFSNGAQITIDQFISSAQTKWGLSSGLVMLLPHGYEGQGPEHSSARLERFLQLCADENMQVVNCTTPANYFHVLRRQIHRDFRKPLVVMTPKSLLRHPKCVSDISEFSTGTKFQEIIDDASAVPEETSKVLFCSGKIYYELLEKKEELQRNDVAIIRLEQLYPLPSKQIKDLVKKYKGTKNWHWVQEEPLNMGSWDYIHRSFTEKKLKVISRPASSSTAEGSAYKHQKAQSKIIAECFNP